MAGSNLRTADICFEVHVRRDKRWLVQDVFEDQAPALEYAQRLRRRHDVGGIRVLRESYDPERDEASEQVVFDTTELLKPFRWLMAPLSGIGLPAARPGR